MDVDFAIQLRLDQAGALGLDEAHLWRWAEELGLRELLESALSQAWGG